MSSARDQVGRLLALVPLIRRRGELPVAEAAETLGVDPAKLVADLRVLMYCGWPGWMPGDLIEVDLDALDGEQLIRIHNADYLGSPVRFSAAEASAVTVALRALRESAPSDTVPTLDSALAKLEAVAEEGAGQVDVQVPAGQRETADLRARLVAACRDRRQVALTYYVPARDEDTERVVDPLAVVDSEGNAYLDAWCRSADGRRLFRLDRVVTAEVLETAADEHPDAAPLDLAERLFHPPADSPLVTLHLAPGARWVAEYYPVEAARELAEDALEVDLRVADPQWLVRLLLRLAPDARIVAPAELAERAAATAREALRLYDPGQVA